MMWTRESVEEGVAHLHKLDMEDGNEGKNDSDKNGKKW